VRFFVGITDSDWFDFLSRLNGLDEVNFWQPSGQQQFRALQIGEPFLFKLHSPDDYVVGGGFFSHFTILPASIVWQAFGEKNGARTEEEMRTRISIGSATGTSPWLMSSAPSSAPERWSKCSSNAEGNLPSPRLWASATMTI